MGVIDRVISDFFDRVSPDFHKKGAILGLIQMCETLYERYALTLPGKDPHEILVGIYNIIMVKSGAIKEKDLEDPAKAWYSIMVTLKPSCLPEPICARALAYTMIAKDEPLYIEFLSKPEFKSYRDEYDKYLFPLLKANKDDIKKLYCKYNKNRENQELMFSD